MGKEGIRSDEIRSVDEQESRTNVSDILGHHEIFGIVLIGYVMYMCSGCSTSTECTDHDQEVVGSNPARSWTFFSFYPLSNVGLIISLAEVQHF